ncbi:VOC family protein [Formosimonas limnophila]|nr:VOC family protein [Formosimonas limnophila]
MSQYLMHVAVVVRDYDEAIAYYTNVLGFELLQDIDQGNKRWVLVKPRGKASCSILLARASDDTQAAFVGNQAGGRVFLFLHTDDFWADYAAMKVAGVRFVEAPRDEAYGMVVVFEDLYGNRWDLLQMKPPVSAS